MVKVSLTLSETVPILYFLRKYPLFKITKYCSLIMKASLLIMRTHLQHVFENIEKLEAYYHIMTINIGHITIRLSI